MQNLGWRKLSADFKRALAEALRRVEDRRIFGYGSVLSSVGLNHLQLLSPEPAQVFFVDPPK